MKKYDYNTFFLTRKKNYRNENEFLINILKENVGTFSILVSPSEYLVKQGNFRVHIFHIRQLKVKLAWR